MAPYFLLAIAAISLTTLGETARRHFSMPSNEATSVGRRRTWTYFDVVSVTVLIIFAGIRFRVGSDYMNYTRIFARVDTTDWLGHLSNESSEPGFALLTLITKSVSESPQIFFFVTSALAIVPVYAAILRSSSRPALAVALYVLLAFYIAPFNIVRQGIAISLVFWAVVRLRHRPLWLIVVGILATSIHTSAAIALVLMWLARSWRPKLRVAVVILLGASALAVAFDRFGSLQSVVGVLTPQYEEHLASGEAGIGTYLLIVAHVGLVVYAAILGRADKRLKAGEEWMMTYILVGVAFMIVGTQAILISRLAFYFTIFLVLLLPERVSRMPHRSRHDLALIASGLAFYALYLQNYGGLLPYQTYFAG